MTTERGDAEEDGSGPFDIYETADGPRHVGSPVRRLILSKMHGSELTVPEMIGATGLTKSTISAHLAQLYKERLVAYREDPTDRRRKFYYLAARHVGTTRRCAERLEFVADGDPDPANPQQVGRLILRALLAELACCGLDLAPVVRETGRRVGELVGRGSSAEDFPSWCATASAFWSTAGLGTLEAVSVDPPVVRVDACGLCFEGADARMSLCQVSAGILEGMASEAFRTAVEVRRLDILDEPNGALVGAGPDGLEGLAGPAEASSGNGGGCGCIFRLFLPDVPHPDATDGTTRRN